MSTTPTPFEQAVEFVLYWEGGFVDDPHDPGRTTKYGISKRQFPDIDIESLTVDEAKEIYLINYWLPLSCDRLPYPLALAAFDMGVNAGVGAGAKCLQRVVRVKDDGRIGDVTVAATKQITRMDLAIRDVGVKRICYYASLPNWPRYGEGWTRRTMACVIEGLKWTRSRIS